MSDDYEVAEAPPEKPQTPKVVTCTVLVRTVDGVQPGRTFRTADFVRARSLRSAGLVSVKAGQRQLSDGDLVRLIEGV
jgi:hypothetical protein